jgi:hypothetical protein
MPMNRSMSPPTRRVRCCCLRLFWSRAPKGCCQKTHYFKTFVSAISPKDDRTLRWSAREPYLTSGKTRASVDRAKVHEYIKDFRHPSWIWHLLSLLSFKSQFNTHHVRNLTNHTNHTTNTRPRQADQHHSRAKVPLRQTRQAGQTSRHELFVRPLSI